MVTEASEANGLYSLARSIIVPMIAAAGAF
jgi:hypothetical protein